MKGIAHFATGVAAASFSPFAVEAAEAGNPLYFVLGGAFPNFLTVWICMTLIFWNLYRHMPSPEYHFNFFQLILYACIIPIGIFGLFFKLANRDRDGVGEEFDATSEWTDSMMG